MFCVLLVKSPGVVLIMSRFSIFSCIQLYFIVHFRFKRRIDVASRKSDAILVLINTRIMEIVMRLVGLANGRQRRCYYTCDHMIFMDGLFH